MGCRPRRVVPGGCGGECVCQASSSLRARKSRNSNEGRTRVGASPVRLSARGRRARFLDHHRRPARCGGRQRLRCECPRTHTAPVTGCTRVRPAADPDSFARAGPACRGLGGSGIQRCHVQADSGRGRQVGRVHQGRDLATDSCRCHRQQCAVLRRRYPPLGAKVARRRHISSGLRGAGWTMSRRSIRRARTRAVASRGP